ncbi:GNAT family N-acetyltransferase [Christiangramia sabulilitoris]|uniref:GNAT family N-acetyltransferase n=1 Tax=Christiangramia sabulilitoris TaxID=2583991 RepID=A0A550I0K9_9FLAO|nr:GNAT family N-acetyltransferase [Christiangramia sabulilitoris]TRO64516.1 GNAT family N-acetyltransferase [Christiangramia sabulilitoris]
MTEIVPVDSEDKVKITADLAKEIWSEHYTPIIGAGQVNYMLEKYQSRTAIWQQLEGGVSYYLLKTGEKHAGYFSFSIQEKSLFLSKFYVLRSERGKGIGKTALKFIEEQAMELQLPKIKLTVNKYNSNSIKAYEKMGFENVGSIVQDIGNGYVMDDYVLEKMVH